MSIARPSRTLCALAAVAASVGVLAGCGEEEETHVKEGEPLELGEQLYNVVISRTLNPGDVSDSQYLEGQPPAPPGMLYLGTFMQIENEADVSVGIPEDFVVVDTQGTEYEPEESESPYALELGGTIPPHGEVPGPDTTAREGPIEGAAMIFLISAESTENRPLELEIPGAAGETGTIELDI